MVASQNCFLHGWRLADRKHFRMLGYPGRVDDWAWAADGAFLATAGASAAIVWPFDGDDGPMTRNAIELAPRAQRVVTAVAWRPEARLLAIGYDDGGVQLASVEDAGGAPPGRCARAAGRRSPRSPGTRAPGASPSAAPAASAASSTADA